MVKIRLTNRKVILLEEPKMIGKKPNIKPNPKRIIYGKFHDDLKKKICNGIYEADITKDNIVIKKRL